MLAEYLPVLVFIIVGLGLGLAMLGAGNLLSTSKPDPEKNSPYECGFSAYENARLPFDVRFYLVAILFILFDLETAFFFPWALVLRELGWFGFMAMMMFLALLVVGFIYEWKRGALDWE
ncbi:MAG: NADH-quinone oxidoreductase subunit A [Legionellaceae bacterium]|nr:NADH-quinone oxidoreductase subunit A [Legionellaceae bacterium]